MLNDHMNLFGPQWLVSACFSEGSSRFSRFLVGRAGFGSFQVVSAGFGSFRFLVIMTDTMADCLDKMYFLCYFYKQIV